MATFTRMALAPGGSEGDGIGLAIQGTTVMDVHECNTTTTTTYHEVHLWASNIGTVVETLILLVGRPDGVSAAAAQKLHYTLQPGETQYVSPGLTIRGAATNVEIAAYLVNNTNDVVIIHGYANVIDQSA